MSLSKAAKKALAVLKAGGKIHQYAKELRLRDREGTIVPGFGPAALKSLDDAGALTVESAMRSGGGRVYVLHPNFVLADTIVETANSAGLRSVSLAAYAVRHAKSSELEHFNEVLRLVVKQARRQEIPDAAIKEALGDLPLPS